MEEAGDPDERHDGCPGSMAYAIVIQSIAAILPQKANM
jgi:hypothetical protein